MAKDKELAVSAKKEKDSKKKDKSKKQGGIAKWFKDLKLELKKVVWPNKKTVLKNTGTVLLCSLVIGACIWIFDFAAVSVVEMILKLAA